MWLGVVLIKRWGDAIDCLREEENGFFPRQVRFFQEFQELCQCAEDNIRFLWLPPVKGNRDWELNLQFENEFQLIFIVHMSIEIAVGDLSLQKEKVSVTSI